MIEFAKKGSIMKCKVTIFIPYEGAVTYHFDHDTTNKYYSALAINEMEDQFAKKIERIRKNAYEKGWQDAKKRRRKEKDFSGAMNFWF